MYKVINMDQIYIISLCVLLYRPAPFDEDAFFLPQYALGFFVKDQVSIGMCIYFWVVNSIPLIYLSCLSLYQHHMVLNHYYSIVQLDVSDGDSIRSSFIVENCFPYPGIFCYFSIRSREQLFLCLWRISLEFSLR